MYKKGIVNIFWIGQFFLILFVIGRVLKVVVCNLGSVGVIVIGNVGGFLLCFNEVVVNVSLGFFKILGFYS